MDTTTTMNTLIPIASSLLIFIGFIGVVWSGFQIIVLTVGHRHPDWPWGKTIGLLIFSLVAKFAGLNLLFKDIDDLIDGSADPADNSDDPTPAPPPPETSTPPAPEPETYTLPVVENLATLWLIPLVLVTLLTGGVIIWLLTRIAQKSKRRARERTRLRGRLNNAYATYRKQHNELDERYTTVHTDWQVWLNYPAITDLTVAETAAMNQAWHRAHQLRETEAHPEPDRDYETLQAQVDSITTQAYPAAIDAYQRAFDTAMATAKRIGTTTIPDSERTAIRRITALLRQAEDHGATAAERQSSYAKATELLAGLRHVTVPERAMVELEQRGALMLET